MAIRRIPLLRGEAEGPVLGTILKAHQPGLEVELISTSDALAAATHEPLDGCRLVSFCSSVIVPQVLLTKLPGPAYNFHPGPPEYPGRYPSVFALYDGAQHFGITVHEMAAPARFIQPDRCAPASVRSACLSFKTSVRRESR